MIECVGKENLEDVLPLIRRYQEFYKAPDISDDRNRKFFAQFGEASNFGCQFLFRENDKALAFVTVSFTFASTIASKVAMLNDLYTEPECRGKGIGRKMLEHCRDYAAKHGAIRLQWSTNLDNSAAQKLYDSMNTHKSKWYLYNYPV